MDRCVIFQLEIGFPPHHFGSMSSTKLVRSYEAPLNSMSTRQANEFVDSDLPNGSAQLVQTVIVVDFKFLWVHNNEAPMHFINVHWYYQRIFQVKVALHG